MGGEKKKVISDEKLFSLIMSQKVLVEYETTRSRCAENRKTVIKKPRNEASEVDLSCATRFPLLCASLSLQQCRQ